MKFFVSHTSGDVEQPCEGATRELQSPTDKRESWAVEINSLDELIALAQTNTERYSVIVKAWPNEPLQLEIYDDYRE